MIKARSAVDLDIPAAAPFEPTMKERSALDLDVLPPDTLEATIKDRSAANVPSPMSPASEWPTARPSEWPTWRPTWGPSESPAPAAQPSTSLANAQAAPADAMPSSVVAQPVAAPFGVPMAPRNARTWPIITALVVAIAGGAVAFIYGSTNAEHASSKALDDAAATKATDAIGGDK